MTVLVENMDRLVGVVRFSAANGVPGVDWIEIGGDCLSAAASIALASEAGS